MRRGLLSVLARRTPWVEDEILGLAAVVPPGSVCLDIGAEYGVYTHALSRLVGRGGRVVAVEPLPGAFRVLSRLVAVRRLRNVVVRRLALGERAEQAALSLPFRRGLPVHGRAYLTSGASGPGPNVEFGSAREVEVEVVDLDGLCEREGLERVDFVKADVEGAELHVLMGGLRTLKEHRPVLLLEVEDRHTQKYGYTAEDLCAWLAEQGYAPHRWIGGAWRRVEGVTPDHRNYLFRP
jgi:FkbM family methyltransferase